MSARPTSAIDLLVVEDSEEMVDLIAAVLRPHGFAVRSARSGAEGLRMFEASPPDLMVIDLGLPILSGEEVFRAVRERSPGSQCVIVTGNQSVDTAIELMRAGAADYIIKPVLPDALIARMTAVRDRLRLHREWDSVRELYDDLDSSTSGMLIGSDPAMTALLRRVSMIARTDAPAIIFGESGTGKERVARALHHASLRKKGPFVAVNLGAVPLSLWESEFFGHVRGAFTDAKSAATGLIASAEGGTLFLDEVGECPLPAQVKLLRFLQEREYRPLGGTRDVRADVRVLAATNRDLEKQVQSGEFREDLYYRLRVIPIAVPPLRERRADIPLLAQHFLVHYAARFGVAVEGFTPSALAKMTSFAWPGNVRELENVVQQVVATATEPLIRAHDLPFPETGEAQPSAVDLSDGLAALGSDALPPFVEARDLATGNFERRYLDRALALAEGNITRAAEMSKMPRKTFSRLLQKHDVRAVRDGVASKPGRPRGRVTSAGADKAQSSDRTSIVSR